MDLKERVKELCKNAGIPVSKLERDCGFANGYVSKLGKSTPNTKNIQKIADYFGMDLNALMTGQDAEGYYYDKETAEIADRIYHDKYMGMVFDAMKDSTPEQIKNFYDMLMVMKRAENHEG